MGNENHLAVSINSLHDCISIFTINMFYCTCPSNITLAQMLLGKLLRCPFSSSMAFKFATWSEISLYNTMYCFRFSRLRDSTRLIFVFTWTKKKQLLLFHTNYQLHFHPIETIKDPKFYVWSLFCPDRDSKNCWMLQCFTETLLILHVQTLDTCMYMIFELKKTLSL